MALNDNTYTTIQGDTWDLISWRVYGNSYAIDRLIYANAQYSDVFRFSAGVVLNVPDVEAHRARLNLPPWRR